MTAYVFFSTKEKLCSDSEKKILFTWWQKNPGSNLKMIELQDILRSLGKTVMVRHLVKRNLTQLLKEKNLCSQVALCWWLINALIDALRWTVDRFIGCVWFVDWCVELEVDWFIGLLDSLVNALSMVDWFLGLLDSCDVMRWIIDRFIDCVGFVDWFVNVDDWSIHWIVGFID